MPRSRLVIVSSRYCDIPRRHNNVYRDGRLRVRHDGELIEIDSRPSDAIAVAVTCDPVLPIYVSEEVLNDVIGDS